LLEGRLALITGAGRGNGRTLALGLAQAGARVVATDMDASTVEETATLVRLEGGEARSFTLPAACEALTMRVGEEIGNVDLLVSNAGIIIRKSMSSPNAASNWKKTIDVNLNGTFNVTLAWLPAIKRTKGSIVNIASIAAYA
jgi:NAD(P)-dependent dehydrogenase (short-subunit alcohol dehydrogenase family)